MTVSLQPVEVECDAPPYPVVEGCRLVGIHRPEDVRWCRAPGFLNGAPGWLIRWVSRTWESLNHFRRPVELTCACGQPLVSLMKYLFTFDNGEQTCYRIGQCERCHRVYWNDA